MAESISQIEDEEGGLATGVGRLLQMRRKLIANSSDQSQTSSTHPEPMPMPAKGKDRTATARQISSEFNESMTEREAVSRVTALAKRLRDKKANPPEC